jgi:hypothetical protein
MHAKLGDVKGLQAILRQMDAQGVTADGLAFLHIGKSCEDGGLTELSMQFYERAEGMGVRVWDKRQNVKNRSRGKNKIKKASSRTHEDSTVER